MCLFPLENSNFNSPAYKSGVRTFSCGACPECLKKRASSWAVRAHFEALDHLDNCMITLTYDSFIRDSQGNKICEKPTDPSLSVDKRHIQLFIKRLRKWCSSFSDEKIKYICCAEYGSRTHRAHYHLILFGVKFPDLVRYKKSKRGSVIYTSSILTKLWSHGICTVDSTRLNGAVARYCTKYTAKSRSDNTFMLCSQHIGLNGMYRAFNGRSYVLDGCEYPIPRVVWQKYIFDKYNEYSDNMDFRYIPHDPRHKTDPFFEDIRYAIGKRRRDVYRAIRNSDDVYNSYLEYWRRKGLEFESLLPDVPTRIALLPDSKYHNYKIAALNVYAQRKRFVPAVAPNSRCISAYERYKSVHVPVCCPRFDTLADTPCLYTASDTKPYYICPFDNEIISKKRRLPVINSFVAKIFYKTSSRQLTF